MSASIDRNLIFGVLALQLDFVSREQWIAAMGVWSHDKSQPIGAVLRAQGALSVPAQDRLDELVEQHIGGDAQRSLATLTSHDPETRPQRADHGDEAARGTIPYVESTESVADRSPAAAAPRQTGQSGMRYRHLRRHARGGLGDVYLAEDLELGRKVALKEIQARYAHDPGSRSRFVLEAEITGGLEHPGIVPVYGLGAYGDGRPYYAMRFIKGDNLGEAIRRFHRTEPRTDHRPEPRTESSAVSGPAPAPLTPLRSVRGSFDSLEFRELLQRLIDMRDTPDVSARRPCGRLPRVRSAMTEKGLLRFSVSPCRCGRDLQPITPGKPESASVSSRRRL